MRGIPTIIWIIGVVLLALIFVPLFTGKPLLNLTLASSGNPMNTPATGVLV